MGIFIETERLRIVPLTAAQLKLWTTDIVALEGELSCSYHAEPLSDVFSSIVEGQIIKVTEDESNWLFHTFWFAILKDESIAIGSLCFKSAPNNAGEVEIGYGLAKEFEGNGYMTEAVGAICSWAKAQDGITHIIAETEKDNPQSQRVLERCGFVIYKRDDAIWWRF